MKPSDVIMAKAWKMINGDRSSGRPIPVESFVNAILEYLDEQHASQELLKGEGGK